MQNLKLLSSNVLVKLLPEREWESSGYNQPYTLCGEAMTDSSCGDFVVGDILFFGLYAGFEHGKDLRIISECDILAVEVSDEG
jgi:hypothetical protein